MNEDLESGLVKRKGYGKAAAEHVERERSKYLRMAKHPGHPDKKAAEKKVRDKLDEFKRKHKERHG